MAKFIPVTDVRLNDDLWSRQFRLVGEVVLPYMWEILNDRVEKAEKSHCIENFKAAAGQSDEDYFGSVFLDSDLYKWIEAVSYNLSGGGNADLELLVNEAIALIEAAQQPDGYLDTYYTLVEPEKRWTSLMEGHELYCAGHLIEAAVAHHQATGKESLLNVACRFADHIAETFGEGKKRGYPGHPGVELALIRLYETTKKEAYRDLAAYFIDERGKQPDVFEQECQVEGHSFIFSEMRQFGPDYFQSHAPVREQQKVTGHAVRAMYLYSAMADMARLGDDEALSDACERLYDNVTQRQMYVTGGVGSARIGERFTSDYDLPPDAAYAETCASVGLMLLSSRMWLLDGKASRYDVWERALNNTVLSGMGQDGQHFFYVNPLEVVPQTVHHNPMLSHIKTQRPRWFSVACCPPNIARILSSLPGYIYAFSGESLYILSHVGSDFTKGGLNVKLSSNNGAYSLEIEGDPRDIYLRLPENTQLVCDQCKINEDGYFVIHHTGGKETYTYTLVPKIRILHAHPSVSAVAGQVCVQRGPVVYCAEAVDNGAPLSGLRLPADAVFTEEQVGWLPDGLPLLKTSGFRISEEGWADTLYDTRLQQYEPCEITLVPYSQWGNRGETEMRVWLIEK